MKILGKRFYFATISVVVVSATSVLLKYDADTYMKLIGIIVGIFTISQSYTDSKKGVKDDRQN